MEARYVESEVFSTRIPLTVLYEPWSAYRTNLPRLSFSMACTVEIITATEDEYSASGVCGVRGMRPLDQSLRSDSSGEPSVLTAERRLNHTQSSSLTRWRALIN